jgi:hypothetical protein
MSSSAFAEDLLLDSDPPQVHITHAKRQLIVTCRSCGRWRTSCALTCGGRQRGFLFESNRHTAIRLGRCIDCEGLLPPGQHHEADLPSTAPPFCSHDQVPIDQVQKFMGHLHLSTTQIYAETSLRNLGDNYICERWGAGQGSPSVGMARLPKGFCGCTLKNRPRAFIKACGRFRFFVREPAPVPVEVLPGAG